MTTYPRVVIRRVEKGRYSTRDGWHVRCYRRPGEGYFAQGCFVETRASAERCKARFLAGEEITLSDMTVPDLRIVR